MTADRPAPPAEKLRPGYHWVAVQQPDDVWRVISRGRCRGRHPDISIRTECGQPAAAAICRPDPRWGSRWWGYCRADLASRFGCWVEAGAVWCWRSEPVRATA